MLRYQAKAVDRHFASVSAIFQRVVVDELELKFKVNSMASKEY